MALEGITQDLSDGSAIYPRDLPLYFRRAQMVRQPSDEARDTLLRLRLLKMGRLHGDGGERNTRPPIPVFISRPS